MSKKLLFGFLLILASILLFFIQRVLWQTGIALPDEKLLDRILLIIILLVSNVFLCFGVRMVTLAILEKFFQGYFKNKIK